MGKTVAAVARCPCLRHGCSEAVVRTKLTSTKRLATVAGSPSSSATKRAASSLLITSHTPSQANTRNERDKTGDGVDAISSVLDRSQRTKRVSADGATASVEVGSSTAASSPMPSARAWANAAPRCTLKAPFRCGVGRPSGVAARRSSELALLSPLPPPLPP